MKEFGAKSLVDKATALFLVEKIDEDELMELNEAFRYMENNNDKQFIPSSIDFDKVDINKSGKLEYSEFLAVSCDIG